MTEYVFQTPEYTDYIFSIWKVHTSPDSPCLFSE